LAAFIDDFSRLLPHGEFYWDEKFPALENTLKKALLKRGIPEIIYVDNGKIFSARRLDAVCAALGIRKISCQPYSPEGKGKIERFFRTVREDFLAEPEVQKVQTLHELNKLFWGWLEVAYHQRLHSSTNATPLERWQQHLGHYHRPVDEKELIELFLWQVDRKVSNIGLVSVEGIDFEVDGILKQRRVQVRYNPFDLSWIQIYYQGRFFQKAYPFKLGRWSSAAKSQPPPPEKPTPTGIKPLQQLAQKHREQKQEQAQKLVSMTPSSPPEPPFTVAMFIHIEVYLNAINTRQWKWQNPSSDSTNPPGAANHPNPGERL
jgi:hypothetical protein